MKTGLKKHGLIKVLAILMAAVICVLGPVMLIPEKAEAADVTISVTPEYKQSTARSMLNPLNVWRKQRNWYYTSSNKVAYIPAGELPNLKYDYTLENYAMLRAAEISVNFDHVRPNGTKSSGLVGNGYQTIGENIYTTTSSNGLNASYVLDKFKEEDCSFNYQGHRRNMLSFTWAANGRHDLGYNAVGIACAKVGNAYFWVQIFGKTTSPNTKATTAVNSKSTKNITLSTSMIKRKSSADLSDIKNVTLNQGTNMTLGKAHINVGCADTFPDTTVKVDVTPTWSVKTPSILTINNNIAYGVKAGSSKATAKESITGSSKTVTFTIKKSNVKNGFIREGNKFHFYRNGVKQTGWVYLTAKDGESVPHYSYFDKATGDIYTGWHYMSAKEGETTPHWTYFGPNGWMRTGWQQMGVGTNNPDGNNPKHWTYFGPNGWMRMGWQTMGTSNNPDGGKVHTSYFGKNGWLQTGWKHFTRADGEAVEHWSYFGGNGWMRTGWQYLGKADGQSTPHWSYFGNRGWLATGRYRINGKEYTFSTGGWLVTPKSP